MMSFQLQRALRSDLHAGVAAFILAGICKTNRSAVFIPHLKIVTMAKRAPLCWKFKTQKACYDDNAKSRVIGKSQSDEGG